ncbi:MAG: serine--tRNA ligase [Bernardetiaceae bacterium]|nr:serine--tRNA ligase [Bernardetiaceae bacterium]
MLQLSFIQEHTDIVIAGLKKRKHVAPETTVQKILTQDGQRKSLQTRLNDLQAQVNQISKQIGMLMREGKKEEAEQAKSKTSALKEDIKAQQEALREVENFLNEALAHIPNIPHESVPVGDSEEDNEVVSLIGEPPAISADALPHWELIKKYDLIDFELGGKITGAGFPVYKGKGARLQRAMQNFFLDKAGEAGYTEVQPPILVNEASGFGTGQLPDKEGQMYKIVDEDLYLIPTAEVPITNIYRDVILEESELPRKHCGYTPCFRREAGSWGAHVRGLNRLHQFDKVEIVQIVKPEDSYTVLEEMRAHVESLLQALGLHYRVLRLCSGDLGFTSALTYDMEVFSAGQKRWLEVSSTSNFETYQASRLKLRYKDKDNQKHLAHTLNGSALAFPRILAAILENNQTPEGIRIPKVLQPYCGFDIIN